jgi:hypothetical protein
MAKKLSVKAPKQKLERHFDPKLEPAAYNHVATKSILTTVQLISSAFDVTPDFFKNSDKIKVDLCHNIVHIKVYSSDQMVVGIFRYEVVAKVGRKHALSARAEFLAAYDMPEDSAENEARAFCARVGLFAAYPYFRALFAHFASAGNIDLPILPVLSADPLKRSEGKQSTITKRSPNEGDDND